MMKKLIFPLICLLAVPVQSATAADEPVQSVTVNGVRNPELRSYRTLVAGLDAFDKHRALAPGAPELRFQVTARSKRARAKMDTLTLKIEGKNVDIPIALAPDHTFVLPRDQAAFDAKAELVLNRSTGQFDGLPLVRTPGLAANVMRLGDLRLECKVLIAAVKNELGFVARAAISSVVGGSDWCDAKAGTFWHATPATINGATIVSGARRAVLKSKDESFLPPLADTSWPDDALIELDMDAVPQG